MRESVMRVLTVIRKYPRLAAAVAALAVLGAVVVLAWFQPQTLLYDTTVEETLPPAAPAAAPATADETETAPAQPSPEATPPLPAAEPVVLAQGEFHALSHPGSGIANVLELGDGQRILRLEAFATDNGPDLFVWLSSAEADAEESAFTEDFVDLGRLKGNQGNQNYDIPADVDLERYRSVVIWCRRFSVGFTAAPLNPV